MCVDQNGLKVYTYLARAGQVGDQVAQGGLLVVLVVHIRARLQQVQGVPQVALQHVKVA
jgi:hypothetical protein